MLAKAMGARVVAGTDTSAGRRKLARKLGLVEHALPADDKAYGKVMALTGGKGCEVTIDCSAAPSARLLALRCTRQWGRCVYVGEGNNVEFAVSPMLIHPQITLYGSWVTSLYHLEELVALLDRWGLHPEDTCTVRLPLSKAARAYDLADKGQTGKVCIVFDEAK
jgi:threonine dehydrogenase-like Zn-dependent dehydrogenase